MTEVKFETVPLARLKLSPLNARFGRTVETADLEASIIGAGRLVQPLSCYAEGDDLMVWDGGRRLLACQALDAGKKSRLPAALKAGLPCLISASADAAALDSLVTFVREGMSPSDQFLAFKALIDKGLAPVEVAAACNVTTARVNQLLRLVALSPAVMEAFRDGIIPLDVAEAFTISDDHERQASVFAGFNPKKGSAWDVRSALSKGALAADDRIARFVGREAYEAAGGRFLVDLFSRSESTTWTDAGLARQLAQDQADLAFAKIKEEGWAWVDWAADTYDWAKGFERIEGKKGRYSKEDMAERGVFMRLLYNGQLEANRGYKKAVKGKGATTVAGKAAQADPALYGYGHGGHAELTMVATRATQAALVANPGAAYDALLSSLAWAAFRKPGRDTNASRLEMLPIWGFPSVELAGDDQLQKERKGWDARLPAGRVAFCDYVAALSAKEKAKLLALSFADTLHAGEQRFDYLRPDRWRHLGWMARHAGLVIAKAWRPSQDFLKKGSKPALFSAMEDVGMNPEVYADCKKSLLVEYLTDGIMAKEWVPKLLATFTDVSDPEPAPRYPEPEPDQNDEASADEEV